MTRSVSEMLRGAIQIRVHGSGAEAFLEACARKGVVFQDILRASDASYTAWAAAGHFRRILQIGRQSGCHVRVIEKRGIPFFARQFLRRGALWVGAILCAVFVVFLSGRVWTIRVEGCSATTQAEILNLLRQAGVKTGAKRSEISLQDVKTHVISKCDKLSYFTLNFVGTNAVAQVWEREDTPEKLAENVPCNVISALSGVILRLHVRMGHPEVKIGDTITAGTTIASGTVVSALGETTLLHASADAVLRTWYTIRAAVPEEILALSSTQRMHVKQCFIFGERRIPLQSIENTEETWYDKHINRRELRLREDFRFPIALESEIRYPCETSGEPATETAISPMLEQRMLLRLRASKPDAEIAGYTFSMERSGSGAWMGVLRAELIETTGISVPIS
ncbi:MAG: sporulation protein YqfD [Clostridia bacterium]|nr:sporulation protein YqfD [Clostridia bacterium]